MDLNFENTSTRRGLVTHGDEKAKKFHNGCCSCVTKGEREEPTIIKRVFVYGSLKNLILK